MNVLIVEDEALAVERLEKLLYELEADIKVVGVTGNVEDTVKWLADNPPPDLLLMDVELGDGHSFEVFNQTVVNTPVIFTTSYDEYAIQAFKVNSIDYLLKPINQEELRQSIQKFKSLNRSFQYPAKTTETLVRLETLIRQLASDRFNYRERFLVKNGNRYVSLQTEKIAYFYFEDRLTFLKNWKNEKFIADFSLDELEQMLSPKFFFRANRQFIVHIDSVVGMQDYFNNKLVVTLNPPSEHQVLVSREKSTLFKTWMGK